MLKKVVYIASVGYSGSTLLDMLLGANDGFTALGEVYLLARYARGSNLCTCGEPLKTCHFWSEVEQQLQEKHGPENELANFDLASEGIQQTIFRKLPSLTDIGLVFGKKALWDVICNHNRNADLFRQAAKNSVSIYELACKVDNSEFIVDSSKYALPLKARYLELKEKMRIVFLVRDGRAVCKSLMKRQNLSMSEAARKWARFNWNLELVLKSIPDSQIYRLKYEELCADTNTTLKNLSEFIGTQSTLEIKPLIKENCHDIGGNPMRFRREETVISIDESWKEKITNEELSIFNKIAGADNRKFGYPVD